MPDARLKIIIDALNLAEGELAKVSEDLEGIEKSGKKAKSGLGAAKDAVGELTGVNLSAAGAIAATGAALKFSIDRALEAQRAMNATEAVIRSTGGVAGFSAQQIGQLSQAQSDLSSVGKNTIQTGVNMLLTFTNIRETLPEATTAMQDVAVAMAGGDISAVRLKDTAIQLGKALNDPIAGMAALREVGVTFNASQVATIKRLQETGDMAGAQRIILAELRTEFGGMAEQMGNTDAGKIQKAQNAINQLGEQIGGKLLPVLGSAAESFSLLMTGNQRVEAALAEHSGQVAKTATNYEDYITEIQRAYAVTNQQVDANGRLIDSVVEENNGLVQLQGAQVALTRAQFEQQRAAKESTQALREEQQATRMANDAMGLYNDTLDGGAVSQKTFADFAAVATETVKSQKAALVGITADAIALTEAEQKRGEVEKELADLNAEIAKNGPVRKAIDKGKTLDANELALAQAKLRVETEKLQNIERGKNETDAEFNLRVLGARAGIADLTAKMGEHTVVVGGATEQQLKQRDALQATLDQMQRAAEIDAAKSAFAALGEALTKGVLSEEEYRAAMLRMNDATGLFSSKALAMATNSALMNDAIRKSKVGDDVINALLRYGDALGSAAQRSLSFAGAPVQGANRRAGGEVIEQAQGGDWLVTRPTLFMAGEAGPERATFQPMSPSASTVNPNYQNSYGGDTIIVNDTRTWALIQAEKRQARTLEARNG